MNRQKIEAGSPWPNPKLNLNLNLLVARVARCEIPTNQTLTFIRFLQGMHEYFLASTDDEASDEVTGLADGLHSRLTLALTLHLRLHPHPTLGVAGLAYDLHSRLILALHLHLHLHLHLQLTPGVAGLAHDLHSGGGLHRCRGMHERAFPEHRTSRDTPR